MGAPRGTGRGGVAAQAEIISAGVRQAIVGANQVPRDTNYYVDVNGSVAVLPGGGRVRADAVKQIRVIGSEFDDLIRLRNVDTRAYRGLNGKVAIDGNGGRDIVEGSAFNDVIRGGEGNDLLDGLAGNDTLDGGNGNDELYGNAGNDLLQGGNGNDFLNGGEGDDTLQGGNGDDLLHGGPGADSFSGGAGLDRINEFRPTLGDRKDSTVEIW